MVSLFEAEEDFSSLFTDCTVTFPLYRQPYRVGDVFDDDGDFVMVVAIQDVHFRSWHSGIRVMYLVQRLGMKSDYPSYSQGSTNPYGLRRCGGRYFLSAEKMPFIYPPGMMVFTEEGYPFQIFQITDLRMESMDLVVDYLCRPVYPYSRETVQSTLKQEQRKSLGLQVL